MSNKLIALLIILLLLLSLTACSLVEFAKDTTTFIESSFYELATVTRIVDGDTIKVDIDGTEYAVRYIGIDTPETVDPRKPVEFMGKEASAKNKELVGEKPVHLERDVSETDGYGRLLRYVWVEQDREWVMVNAELVRLGYAQVATYPPDVKYQSLFLELQRQAKQQKLGLWAE